MLTMKLKIYGKKRPNLELLAELSDTVGEDFDAMSNRPHLVLKVSKLVFFVT